MDPLSILTSSITLASAVITCADQLQQLLKASQQLHDLIDEVKKLRSILDDAHRAIAERKKHSGLPQQAVDAGSRIITETQLQLERLNEILAHCLKPPKERSCRSRLAYISWLRSRGEIKNIQQNLISGRLSLCSIWGVIEM
jgi:hypothetical protein